MLPQFYAVLGNRDYLKVAGERVPIWRFIEGEHRHWLTSLAYIGGKGAQFPPGRRFLDCGAWSYKQAPEPKWSPRQCLDLYAKYAQPGDILAAPDHMLLRDHDETERRRRQEITVANARAFLAECPAEFTPIAVVHGHSPEERVHQARVLLDMGYRALAVGGVAIRAGNRKYITAVLEDLARLRSEAPFYLHVLGVSALSWYPAYVEHGVDSYDGSAMFYAAFTGAAYYWLNDAGVIIKYSTKDTDPETLPRCDCLACATMRAEGHDTRAMGSNERNMGRAVHNINAYLRSLARLTSEQPWQTSLRQQSLSLEVQP